MNDDLSVDYQGLRELIEYYVDAGVQGLTPCAVTAEAETLDLKEQRDVLRTVIEAAAGRVPVYCGVGRPSIVETRNLIDHVKDIGADGLFLITPYASGVTLSEVVDYITSVVSASELPTMMYNCPGYAKVDIPSSVIADLSRQDLIMSVKEGNQNQLHDSVRLTAPGFGVFTARDSYLLPSMSMGAVGVVSFVANVAPLLMISLYDAISECRLEDARVLHLQVCELVEALVARSYPVLIKEAVGAIGLPAGPSRRVGGGATEEEAAHLRRVLSSVGLLPEAASV